MSLFQSRSPLAVGPRVRQILGDFARNPDREAAAAMLSSAAAALGSEEHRQLMARLAELSVAQLAVLDRRPSRNVAEPREQE